jgi:CRISPR-associated endonuclease/helicase Cas3
MSATLEQTGLDTIDFRGQFPAAPLGLTEADYDPTKPLYKRMTASKTLELLGVTLTKEADDKELKAVAAAVVAKHQTGTQTLVVVNTVRRAKAIYAAIKKCKNAPGDVLLVHSRFRPAEREKLNEQLREKAADRILIATQVVEAGVDISSRTLITELAPWASIVQRIGRCNRTGDDGPGRVFWIDIDTSDEKRALPYSVDDLTFARQQLEKLAGQDVSPKALDEFKVREGIKLPFEHLHVLRRRDLLDLFDTSADLSGNDIDIARWVRGDDVDTDVQFFWRTWENTKPPQDTSAPHRRELCSVPVHEARTFLGNRKGVAYLWDHLEDDWRPIRDPDREVRPGLAILLPNSAGGYSILGWDSDSKTAVTPVPEPTLAEEGTSDDPLSAGPAFTIAEHTEHVCAELERLLAELAGLLPEWETELRTAARWHDAGKVHEAFQAGMHSANRNLDPGKLWAKSGGTGRLRHGRKHFRHELVSALVALQAKLSFEVAYLIATHHGKVRLSIRTLPDEEQPAEASRLFAQGVHDGDVLPAVDLGGVECPATTIDLSPMQLGGEESWTGQALTLRNRIGPFRLAYLEALLRAADAYASAKERKEVAHAAD